MKHWCKIWSLLLLLILVSSCVSKQPRNSFVKVKDTQFVRNGKPYRFLGVNLWYGANLGADALHGDRERLVRELDKLASLGITNLRILGASEGFSDFNTVNPPIQTEPGVYDEKLLEGLDFLLAEMAKRDMTAVIFLNNFWVWSGGMGQYMAWAEDKPVPNPFLEQYSWDEFMSFSAQFYQNSEAIQQYQNYIKMLVNRTNAFTGIHYKNDPTIMSWQLANEPRPGPDSQGLENSEVFLQWIDESAEFIKSIDPNHLISTGNEGVAGCVWSPELCGKVNRIQSIDYMTAHLWVFNWLWFDPLNAEETYREAEKKALEYLQLHADISQRVNKPLVLEEFGIPRDNHSFNPQSTTEYRDNFLAKVYEFVFQNAQTDSVFAGSNVWSWAGEGRPTDPENSQWKVGDTFTGDPPQEPQGRNSIFDSDTSTLKIIGKYAELMNGLY